MQRFGSSVELYRTGQRFLFNHFFIFFGFWCNKPTKRYIPMIPIDVRKNRTMAKPSSGHIQTSVASLLIPPSAAEGRKAIEKRESHHFEARTTIRCLIGNKGSQEPVGESSPKCATRELHSIEFACEKPRSNLEKPNTLRGPGRGAGGRRAHQGFPPYRGRR